MTKIYQLSNYEKDGWYYRIVPVTTETITNVEKCFKTINSEFVQSIVPDLNNFTVV